MTVMKTANGAAPAKEVPERQEGTMVIERPQQTAPTSIIGNAQEKESFPDKISRLIRNEPDWTRVDTTPFRKGWWAALKEDLANILKGGPK
jgi:hypothetical protein